MNTDSSPPALVARDVWKEFELGDVVVQALRGVNVELPAGKFVVLLGPSGSGKTTVLNLAGGLDVPSRGELTVFGQRVDHLGERALTTFRRETVGFVFQMFNLVPTLTALENVRLIGQLVGTDELASEMLDAVGLADRANQLPSQLSGGEQQRVAIARALVKQPRLMLADEPTGSLDTETGRDVLSLLWDETRRRGMTVMMVTHNLGFAALGDIVVRLRSGEVVEFSEQKAVHPGNVSF